MRDRGISVVRASSIYETDPVGPPQPDFLNAVVEIETKLSPVELLRALKEIESEVGRRPEKQWGPREVDLDILLYGEETVRTDELEIPHPELRRRAFVLVPLLELDPEVALPSGERVEDFVEEEPAGVRRWRGPESLMIEG